MKIKHLFNLSLMVLIFMTVSSTVESQALLCDLKSQSQDKPSMLQSQVAEGIATIKVLLDVRVGEQTEITNIEIPNSYDVNQAVASIYRVTNGIVCCKPTDILCINDVCSDTKLGKYWTITINGNYQNVSANSILNDGDVLVLTYNSPNNHARLST